MNRLWARRPVGICRSDACEMPTPTPA
jgi:hypothetical protein